MIKFRALVGASLAAASLVSTADAKVTHHSGHYRYAAERYSRTGPAYGYKFGWATYWGDPFASDDYFDGHNCYYLHHKDFCLGPRRRGGFRW
jgi:hypothetical protein